VLTERQDLILRLLVDAYLETGRPVASKPIAERPEIEWGPSTVRAELAALEAAGYLAQPHTSAGRAPTEVGYRHYVDSLIEEGRPPAGPRELGLVRLRREIDEAMRETSAALSRATDLIALVTAPQPAATTIHRVEVLQLRPTRVVVIAISSTGAVAKRTIDFEEPVDRGLVEWSSSFLNETVAGMAVGSRMIADRLAAGDLGPVEAQFVRTLSSAFTQLDRDAGEVLYMDGASRLLSDAHLDDLPRADRLMTALERRATMLGMLRSALDERSVFLWIGDENPHPDLRTVSVVGANYGLAHRNLGAVGVVGPLRMDYASAISSVRGAARELSRYCESVYGG
jgi:heat-inducible transcriptional repressor